MKFTFYSIFLLLGSLISISSIAGVGQTQKEKASLAKSKPFAENKNWEMRLNDRLRSSTDIQLISPISGTNYDSDRLVFEWNAGKKQKVFLGLMNNENKEVFYKEVVGNKVVILASEIKLTPGLYYWVLENEADVLNVGKLFYKKL